MAFFDLFLISVGLAMDAFAVAIGKGLSLPRANLKKMLIIGLYFGLFQAIMPVIGYFIGVQFADKITMFDHWIAFLLLAFIGGKMIVSGVKSRQKDSFEQYADTRFHTMLPLAVATSIDALAVGVSFAFLQVQIAPAALMIGIITLALSMLGVKLGNIFGSRYRAVAEILGGIILILLGSNILWEHLHMV